MASGLAHDDDLMVLSGDQRGRDVLALPVCALKRPSQLAASFLLTVFTDAGPPLHAALVRRSLAKHSPAVLLAHFIGDAGPRQPHELGKRRVRPARATRQRGNEARGVYS